MLMPQSHQPFRPVPAVKLLGLCWEIDVGPPLFTLLLVSKLTGVISPSAGGCGLRLPANIQAPLPKLSQSHQSHRFHFVFWDNRFEFIPLPQNHTRSFWRRPGKGVEEFAWMQPSLSSSFLEWLWCVASDLPSILSTALLLRSAKCLYENPERIFLVYKF